MALLAAFLGATFFANFFFKDFILRGHPNARLNFESNLRQLLFFGEFAITPEPKPCCLHQFKRSLSSQEVWLFELSSSEDVESESDISDAILHLLQNSDVRVGLSNMAVKRSLEVFGTQKILANYLETYRLLAG